MTVEAIVIGGSAGSVTALGAILPHLPRTFPPVIVVVHVLPTAPSRLPEVFVARCAMTVREAEASMPLEPGTITFAPSDYHLLVETDRTCALSIAPPVLFSRPAIDVLFESASYVYRSGLVGLILTGANTDGARGLADVHAAGGVTFVQDPASAEANVMPSAAWAANPAARMLPLADIAAALRSVVETA